MKACLEQNNHLLTSPAQFLRHFARCLTFRVHQKSLSLFLFLAYQHDLLHSGSVDGSPTVTIIYCLLQ